jgi:peptidyl-prolyl cis-trans isomerase SurA
MVAGIAAQVGSEIVLVSEVRILMAPMEPKMRRAGATEAEIEAMRSDALERLIERALIRQVVKRAELDASDVEVDQAIATIAEQNGISHEQLVAAVEGGGLPYDVYRERIRAEIEQSKVLNGMVAAKVRVSESEVKAAYHEEYADQPEGGSEVHLRHLLVPLLGEGADARRAACATAERARARLLEGEAFDLVVAETGNTPGSGDIGWLHEARLASWMAPQVESAEPGAITPVIETEFGCNVVQVVERRPFRPASYEEAKEHIHDRLFGERMQREYLRFMDRLREQTYVERKGVFAQAPVGAGPSGFGDGSREDPSGF